MKSLVIVPPLTYEYLPKCRVEFNAVFSILIEEGTLLQKNLKIVASIRQQMDSSDYNLTLTHKISWTTLS